MPRTGPTSGWGCTACGYVFVPGAGDPGRNEIDPAWAFDNLPADWRCPECGSAKHKFRALKHDKDKKNEKEQKKH